MNPKIKKIINIIVHVIAIGLLAVMAVAFIFSKVSGSPFFIFGKTTLWVMTDSMSPTIPARTYVLVEEVSAEDVKVGDIIAFTSTDPSIYGQLNTHRVIEKNGSTFVTKGDNNFADDGIYSAKAENIVARYVRSLPIMTFFGRIVLSEVGFALIIIIFVALVLICYLPDLKRALKEMAKEKKPSDQIELDEQTRQEFEKRVEEELKKLRENSSDKE